MYRSAVSVKLRSPLGLERLCDLMALVTTDATAREKINPAQAEFITRLEAELA